MSAWWCAKEQLLPITQSSKSFFPGLFGLLSWLDLRKPSMAETLFQFTLIVQYFSWFIYVYFISHHFSRFSFRRCFNLLSSKVLGLDRSFGSSQAPFSAKEVGRADNIVDLEVQNLRGQRMAEKNRKVSTCHRTLFKKRSTSKPCLSHVCHMQAAASATGDFRDYSEVPMCSSSSLKKSLSDVNRQASLDKSLRIGKVRYCWCLQSPRDENTQRYTLPFLQSPTLIAFWQIHLSSCCFKTKTTSSLPPRLQSNHSLQNVFGSIHLGKMMRMQTSAYNSSYSRLSDVLIELVTSVRGSCKKTDQNAIARIQLIQHTFVSTVWRTFSCDRTVSQSVQTRTLLRCSALLR